MPKVQFVAPAPAPIILSSSFKPSMGNIIKPSRSPAKKNSIKTEFCDESSYGFDEWDEDYVDDVPSKKINGKKRMNNTSIQSLYDETYNNSSSSEAISSATSSRAKKKLKGVTYHPESNRYRSRIKIGTRTTHLGYFFTEAGAAKAYDRAAVEIRGVRATTNFPVEVGTYFVPPGSPRTRCIAAARSVVEDQQF